MFGCRRKDSGRYILNMLRYLDSLFRLSIQKWNTEVQSGSNESMHKYIRRMATDIFLDAANISKVVEGGRSLPCIRLTETRYFIDMSVSHRTPMFLQYSSQIVETETVYLNLLLNFYIHSSHICSHSKKVPILFPNVEPSVFWSTETTIISKLTLGKGKRTQVFQDLWRVL